MVFMSQLPERRWLVTAAVVFALLPFLLFLSFIHIFFPEVP